MDIKNYEIENKFKADNSIKYKNFEDMKSRQATFVSLFPGIE